MEWQKILERSSMDIWELRMKWIQMKVLEH